MAIKRSPEVFKTIAEIWKSINPKNSGAISKDIYTLLISTFAQEFGLTASSTYITYDNRIDFVANNYVITF